MIALKPLRQKGFTIVELMIATAVLSTILLLVTVLMINIGSLYYKGINQARVQDNVRGVSDEIAQQLQTGAYFNHAVGSNNQQVYCVGSLRYTYVIGVQIGTPQPPGSAGTAYQHVLWRDDNPAPGTCSITADDTVKVDLTQSQPDGNAEAVLGRKLHGVELIAPRSRLTNLAITGTSPYALSVGVAYADNDLLCNPTVVAGSCTTGTAMPNYTPDYTTGNLLCKGSTGNQFCSTAKLNTSAVKRLP